MTSVRFQRGQFLVAGLVLIAVVGLMIAALGYLAISTQRAGSLHGQSDQAYFAARSGIEFAARQYYAGATCASLNNATGQVGGAGTTFTLTPTPTLFAPLAPTATTAALTATSSSIAVASTTGYAGQGRILVDSELINYASITATSFDGVTRKAEGTTAAAHASGATVSQNVCQISSRGDAGNARRVVVGTLGSANTASPGALGTMGVDAMVVYGKGTSIATAGTADRNVYFRLWDASAADWGAEQTAQQVGANSSPLYFVVQFARTRNEAIMGVLDGANRLYIQVWNGRAWTIPAGGGPLTTAWNASTNSGVTNLARTFQIAYEYNSDRALIVYQDNTNSPKYVIWNGSTLSASAAVSGAYPVGNGASNNLCGGNNAASTRHLWFRMAPRNVSGSDDILMMSTDCNQDVYGMRWTSGAWSNMGNTTRWDTSTSNSNNRNAVDVAWQSNGSTALFAYADATTRQIAYRTWNATTSTLTPTGNNSASSTIRPAFPAGYTAAIFEWIRLYPDPNNNILVLAQSDTRSLVSTMFTSGGVPVGGTYDGHENAGVESATSRSFDFAWEKLPSASGSGWLLWGSGGSGAVRQRYFTSPATWAGIGATILDNALVVQQGVLSPSGRFITDNYQATASTNDDILSATRVGGSGTAWPNVSTQLWAGPTTVQQGERVFVMTREGPRINTGASGTGVVSILQTVEPH